MAVRFLTNYPALFISDKKILVISELHLGLEYELHKSGIKIPSQRIKFEDTIDELIQLTKAKTLVILGDIKHKVPGSTIREDVEIPKFLENLKQKIKVILVKGNHDDKIEGIIPLGVKIYGSRGFKTGKYGFFHGHAWPSKKLMECDYLFMGHVHPAIEFRDSFGFRSVLSIWLKGKLDQELVRKKYKIKKTGKLNSTILPTFNSILGGAALNRIAKERHTGPLFVNKIFDVENSKVYLLDGTYLGVLKDLKK
jgi:putative SbcD/Mre11-related phosphoesterase